MSATKAQWTPVDKPRRRVTRTRDRQRRTSYPARGELLNDARKKTHGSGHTQVFGATHVPLSEHLLTKVSRARTGTAYGDSTWRPKTQEGTGTWKRRASAAGPGRVAAAGGVVATWKRQAPAVSGRRRETPRSEKKSRGLQHVYIRGTGKEKWASSPPRAPPARSRT